jgi:hypothetical protein
MEDRFLFICPYCGEAVEIYLEPDVEESLVQDCEVCCNPGNSVSGLTAAIAT